jgi:hypothetical protein
MRQAALARGFAILALKQRNKKGKQTEGKRYEETSFDWIGGNWVRFCSGPAL